MTAADLIAIGIFWIGLCLAAAWFFCRQARWARRMEAELTDTTGGKQGTPMSLRMKRRRGPVAITTAPPDREEFSNTAMGIYEVARWASNGRKIGWGLWRAIRYPLKSGHLQHLPHLPQLEGRALSGFWAATVEQSSTQGRLGALRSFIHAIGG